MKAFIQYIIIAIMCTANVFSIEGKTVSYLHKPLAAEGCSMEYSVSKQGDNYCIIATATSDRLYFLDNPEMKVRTFNDEVVTLKGEVIGNSRGATAGYAIGNVVVSDTEIKTSAMFYATPEQFEKMKSGVAKIRLSMRPMNHERIFKKDKIGYAIYEMYIDAMEKDNNF